ncbi:MAG: DNA-binding protein WhiA [Thermicanus sp.]|nr:DNA-binding protein WhiA [Thermicanus sp.]
MSFASQTKKELTQIPLEPCCQRAELSAMIKMNGSLHLHLHRMILDITTENAAIARRIYTLLKERFGIQGEVLVRKKMRLKKNNTYIIRIPDRAEEVMEELALIDEQFQLKDEIDAEVIQNACCKRSYLRGAFLAGGSVNSPESNSYHLEIFTAEEEHARSLLHLTEHFGLNARLLRRKKGFILYLKEGEKITEFLNIIGAHSALLHFEDVRIMKDMRNSVNRLVNCETANLNKTVSASMKQIEAIRRIEEKIGLDQLPKRLREVAELRLSHPDMNLAELGQLLPGGPVSKSGVNHRLRKIYEIALKMEATNDQKMV